MPAMKPLFVSASLLRAASGLAQHPTHRAAHATDLVEKPVFEREDAENAIDEFASPDNAVDEFYELASKHHTSHAMNGTGFEGHSIWNTCSKVNSFDGWKPVDEDRCLDANLIFMRVFKTGTSSMSGVLLRIAARHGVNGIEEKDAGHMPEPLVSTHHFKRADWAIEPFVKKLKEFKKPNILLAMVRDPVERWLSHYYYRLTKDNPCHGDKACGVVEFLETVAMEEPNFEMRFLRQGKAGGKCTSKECEPDMDQGSTAVLHSYPWVGIQERFDESVVLLMYVLGIDSYCDMLYIDSKISKDGVDFFGEHWKPHIPLEKQPEKVKEFVASEKFQKSIKLDKNLHKFANLRLDQQIKSIGKKNFETRLKIYRKWLNQAQSSCEGDKSSFKGCYTEDLGCKYKCLDAFCEAHGDALKVEDDAAPMWQDKMFTAPLVQSISTDKNR